MRKGIFAIVLAAHVIGLLLLSFHAPQQRTVGYSPTMTAVILEERRSEQNEVPRTPVLPPLRTITIRPPEELPSVTPGEGSETPKGASSSAITDFSTSAHDVAEEMARRDGSHAYRSLDRQTQAAPQMKREHSIFAVPQHEANTTEHFEDGGDRYYVSGNCFYDFDREPPPATDLMAGPKLKVPKCKPPSGSGNQDMFKDLTPESLKRLPGSPHP